MGQGGWRGSGLGGSQPGRAAASALGNIVFFWLVTQAMHPAWAPPPNPTTPVLSQSQGFLERGLGGRGSPPPQARLSSGDSHPPSPQPVPTTPGIRFPLLLDCTHLLAGSQSWRPRFCKRTRTFAPSQRPPSELESLVIMTAERGRKGREEHESRMRKLNWDRASGPAWCLDLGRGKKGRNEALGLVP